MISSFFSELGDCSYPGTISKVLILLFYFLGLIYCLVSVIIDDQNDIFVKISYVVGNLNIQFLMLFQTFAFYYFSHVGFDEKLSKSANVATERYKVMKRINMT